MKTYYEAVGQENWFDIIPLTFHIKEGIHDKEFFKFCEVFKDCENSPYGSFENLGTQVWIVKPGENTNRGCGINVCREL
jgi:hypothetical protein